ncbi:MAG: SPOR domain-containing protein [Steroidobacteraceae bacterium]
MSKTRLSGRKLTSRDYKDARYSSIDYGRWKEFSAGLAIGLIVALGVYFTQHQPAPPSDAQPTHPTPQKKVSEAAEAEDTAAQLQFYDRLQKMEVIVPEKEQEVKRDRLAQCVNRPGAYVLQVSSYRNFADADRVRQQLAKQRLDARVQRVTMDTDVWHRVVIGPLRDQKEVNRLCDQLRATDLDPLVMRIGD